MRLRPLAETDLDLVLAWRNSEAIRAVSKTQHEISPEEHRHWYERLKNAQDAEAWIYEQNQKPLGFASIHQIDREKSQCWWSFYVGDREAPKGSGTMLCSLVLRRVFENLRIQKLKAEVISTNYKGLTFHEKFGFRRGQTIKNFEGKDFDLIEMELTRNSWKDRQS